MIGAEVEIATKFAVSVPFPWSVRYGPRIARAAAFETVQPAKASPPHGSALRGYVPLSKRGTTAGPGAAYGVPFRTVSPHEVGFQARVTESTGRKYCQTAVRVPFPASVTATLGPDPVTETPPEVDHPTKAYE